MNADIRAIYRSAWTFALACPMLFLVPVVVEFAQHVVEMQLGMYVDEAGAKAAESDPRRLQFGFVKTLALLLPGYWFTRWIMFEGDARRAARFEWPAIGLWLVLFAIAAVQSYWGLFGPSLTGLAGLEGQGARYAGYALIVAEVLLGLYLAAWTVAWPLGNSSLGPLRSLTVMRGSILHALGLMIAGMVPLMALHYGLAIAAVVATPDWADWLLMIFDSVVVGFLALTLTGSGIEAARHAARRRGVSLLTADDQRRALASV